MGVCGCVWVGVCALHVRRLLAYFKILWHRCCCYLFVVSARFLQCVNSLNGLSDLRLLERRRRRRRRWRATACEQRYFRCVHTNGKCTLAIVCWTSTPKNDTQQDENHRRLPFNFILSTVIPPFISYKQEYKSFNKIADDRLASLDGCASAHTVIHRSARPIQKGNVSF